METIRNKALLVLTHLRANARMKLTTLSRKTKIPVSTLFDHLKTPSPLMTKYTALLDFSKLGFTTRAHIIVKLAKEQREHFQGFILQHTSINSAYRINNGFDYLLEGIFHDLKELEEFLETMEEQYPLKMKQVYYIIDDLKREEFLSHPSHLEMVTQSPNEGGSFK
ncbi:Lrp/AsnC family transcriptional regulator [Candidatus Woesearchaeota archaeon]|nr:Lrp/AsnC family transcriptional regulator [Candidatus Woesearchaeota archaeon]